MLLLLQAFWQLLILRKSPETIPYSRFLLGTTLLTQLLLGTSFSFILHRPVSGEFAVTLLSVGLLVSFAYLLLRFYRVRNRLVQTVTAIAGCEILLSVMALPVNIWLLSVDKSNAELPGMLSLMLIGWYVAVVAHIWRHALGVPQWLGYLYAIGYVIFSFLLATLI